MLQVLRRLATSTFAVVAAVLAVAPAAVAAGPPQPVTLADGWEFQLRPDGPWERVRVPHVFDGSANENLFQGTIAKYRLRFRAPQTRPGWGWDLQFESVRRRAKVVLNGEPIGENRDPYTPFRLPASSLRAGAENELTVTVDNRRTAGFREGWWNWGGITRSVRLEPRGRVSLDDVGLLSRVDCSGVCRAEVLVDGWVTNHTDEPQRPHVAVRLQAPDDDAATQKTVKLRTIRPGETARVQYRVPVPGAPKLWAPEQPNLYDATVQARLGDVVQDTDSERVGLRAVRVRDGQLWLNGRRLDLRGASIQEDMPGRGPALTDADVERIVGDLKAVGANVTRAHYLLDERLLRRFDEEGILVWSQAPVYHRDRLLRTPGQRSFELDSLRDTILGARSHPSVITHSVANELTPQPDKVRTTRLWLRNAADLARDLDPTLPVSLDVLSYPGVPRQRTYDRFDMLGINSYYGWYEGKPERSTANLSDLEPYLRAMHAKYPAMALVMTEFGAEATEPGPADVKQTYDFQTRYLERNLDIIDRLGFMGGAIYWTSREFAVKPRWDGGAHPLTRDSIHNKALIAYDGTPKPAYEVARAAFKATPLYRDDPAAVARAELAESPAIALRTLLVLGVLGFVAALLVLDGLCLRDIWRYRPRDAQVVELRDRRAA